MRQSQNRNFLSILSTILLVTFLLFVPVSQAQVCAPPTAQWLDVLGDETSVGGDTVRDIAKHPTLDLLVAVGQYRGTLASNPAGSTLGPSTPYSLTAGLSKDGFLSLIDTTTGYRYGLEFAPTGAHDEEIEKTAFANNGDLYYVGKHAIYGLTPPYSIFNANPFPGQTPNFFQRTYNDIFITKVNANAVYAWTKWLEILPPYNGWDIHVDDMAVDSLGNVYVVGNFKGSVDFESPTRNHVLTSTNNSMDSFVVKYNADGSFGWVYRVVSSADDTADALAIDANNNLVVVGDVIFTSGQTINFNTASGPLSGYGGSDSYVLKMTHAGVPSQAFVIGSPGYEVVGGVAIDANNNPYIAGVFSSTAQFGALNLGGNNFTATSSGSSDMYAIQYDQSSWNVLSFNHYGAGSAMPVPGQVKVNACNQAIVGGWVHNPNTTPVIIPGIGAIHGGPGLDLFVMKFANGFQVWSLPLGTPHSDEVYSMEMLGNGSFAISGTIQSYSVPNSSVSGVILKFDDNNPICGCP